MTTDTPPPVPPQSPDEVRRLMPSVNLYKTAVDNLYGSRNDGLVMDEAAARVANAVLAEVVRHVERTCGQLHVGCVSTVIKQISSLEAKK